MQSTFKLCDIYLASFIKKKIINKKNKDICKMH